MKERPILFSGPMVRALLAGTKTQTRRVMKVQPPADGYELATCISTTGDRRDEGRQHWLKRDGYRVLDGSQPYFSCPYGQPGDRLWVRETCRADELPDGLDGVRYLADDHFEPIKNTEGAADQWVSMHHYRGGNGGGLIGPTVPPIHMPRWASRITLDITAVRVERLQDISEADAVAEGINELVPPQNRGEGLTPGALCLAATMAVEAMPKLTRRAFLGGALAAALGFKASPSSPWEVQAAPWTRAPSPQQVYALLWEQINGPGSWDANPLVWVVEFKRVTP